MTSEEAAWVRANVWTQAMRKTDRECPRYFHTCACQSGLTSFCQHGQCGQCHRATPQRNAEAMICGRGGTQPVYFAEPYKHRTDIYATDPRFERVALVWLADRVCRWVCPHDCHDGVGQGSLFDLAVSA